MSSPSTDRYGTLQSVLIESYFTASSALTGLIAGRGGCIDSPSESSSDSSSLEIGSSDDGDVPDLAFPGLLATVGVSDLRFIALGAMILPFRGFLASLAVKPLSLARRFLISFRDFRGMYAGMVVLVMGTSVS